MKANKIAAQLASELIDRRIFDERAETVEEIAMKTGMSYQHTARRMVELERAGKVERVWKQGRVRPVPAYRIKRK